MLYLSYFPPLPPFLCHLCIFVIAILYCPVSQYLPVSLSSPPSLFTSLPPSFLSLPPLLLSSSSLSPYISNFSYFLSPFSHSLVFRQKSKNKFYNSNPPSFAGHKLEPPTRALHSRKRFLFQPSSYHYYHFSIFSIIPKISYCCNELINHPHDHENQRV